MKGDMGQFFTPRQVVDMMVCMLRPGLNETVCDPACGSGGFLSYAMKRVFAFVGETWDSADDRAEQRKDYAQESLVGIDNDGRLVRVAKAYMIMENDGRSGIRDIDSLDYEVWPKDLRESVIGRKLKSSDMANASLRGGPHPLDRFSSQLRWNPIHDSSCFVCWLSSSPSVSVRFLRRPAVERRVGPAPVVEVHPQADSSPGLGASSELGQVDALVFE